MRNLGLLFRGEMLRMQRYYVMAASLLVVVVWVLLLHLAGASNIGISLPLVLFVDATMMSILLVGVIMLFEKQEGATKSMLVLPIGKGEYLAAKILAAISSSVLTLVLVLIYAVGFREVRVNIPGVVAAVVLVAGAFTLLGVVITYRARDFTGLLMWTVGLIFLLAVPTVLEALEMIEGEWLTRLQYLNPTKSAFIILVAGVEKVPGDELWRSVVYLALMGLVTGWLAWRGFDTYAAREIGG